MNKTLVIIGLLAMTFISAVQLTVESKTAATVQVIDGYSIFFCSSPTDPYESLGEVKIKVSMSGKPTELFNQVLKRVKKDYPKADGILFDGVAMEKATAIVFK